MSLPTGLAASLLGAAEGASFDDASATNRVLAIVGALCVLGVVVLVFTWWFWKSTRPEPEALAPLELLGTRRVRRIDSDSRRRALDSVRPSVVAATPDQPPEVVDLAALAARDLPPIEELQDSDPRQP